MADPGGLRPIDTDPIAFRDAVLRHLVADDDAGLREAADAVMAPIFVEKMIDEIRPGNPWNDLLFLIVRRLLAVSAELRYHAPGLEAKRAFVTRPDARLDEVALVEVGDQGIEIRLPR